MSTTDKDKDKEIKVKPIKQEDIPNPTINDTLVQMFKPASDQITYNNMSKLTKQDAFTIGDKQYNRRRLKPKDLIEFNKIYSEVTTTPDADIEKKMDLMKKSALIALEDFTEKDFEDTDIAMLEQVLAACFLITKGFREV